MLNTANTNTQSAVELWSIRLVLWPLVLVHEHFRLYDKRNLEHKFVSDIILALALDRPNQIVVTKDRAGIASKEKPEWPLDKPIPNFKTEEEEIEFWLLELQ